MPPPMLPQDTPAAPVTSSRPGFRRGDVILEGFYPGRKSSSRLISPGHVLPDVVTRPFAVLQLAANSMTATGCGIHELAANCAQDRTENCS
jgi:hypothetical protein